MKNSFIVQYSVSLWIASLGLSSFWGGILSFIAIRIIGSIADRGIIKLDIGLDKLKEAMKDPKWRESAAKIYEKASARVYSEEEKESIRKEYQDILSKYATFGNGVLNSGENK